MSRFKDMTGQKFGRLTVTGFSHIKKASHRSAHAYWNVICDCGNTLVVNGKSLRDGNTQSCGCLRRERLLSANTKANGVAALNQIIASYKRHAKKINVQYLLTTEQVIDLLYQPCHYCGIMPNQVSGKNYISGAIVYNGIDRKDSNGDYIIENVVTACGICNRAKYTMPYEEYMKWIQRLKNTV